MALPKLNTPTYELVLPSTNEKIKFRPFLVKEQKVLLIAQESNDDEQVANAMGHLVKECTFGKVNPDTAPMFDIEYLFLRIRGKAVGETVELNITCPDDEKTKVRTKVNLDEINVQMTAEHTNEIKLSDSIKMFLRYPLLSDMKGVIGDVGDIERVFAILKKCINEIHHGDKIYNRVDITDKELEEFIDSMTNDQLQTVMDFFDTMPKLRHAVKVTNPKTKVKSEVVVEGLQSFLG
tara:strand:- start:202 stop:909 length:708 start_codon:yes stop_codon:yes gene_type:complete